jgi:hypothetical protein
MSQTVTHIDTKRSILWTFEDPESEKLCRLLTNLYLWVVNHNTKLTNEEITTDLNRLVINLNKMAGKKVMGKIKVLERNRVDDLIY